MENKKLLLALILMVPVSIGLFFYGSGLYKEDHSYRSDSNISDKNDNKEDNSNKVLNSNEINELVSFIFKDNSNIYSNIDSTYNNYFYKSDKLEVKNIKMEDRLAIVANFLNKDKIDLEEMRVTYSKIFGNSIKFNPISFKGVCGDYTYNKANKQFVSVEFKCSILDSSSGVLSYLYNTKQENGVIEVYEYFINVSYDDVNYSYYSDLDKKNLIIESKKSLDIDNLIKNHSDKLGKFKYTFKFDNDNYIFDSIEKMS